MAVRIVAIFLLVSGCVSQETQPRRLMCNTIFVDRVIYELCQEWRSQR